MVERRVQEGMTAPNPETKFRVLDTTLAELGVDTSFDNLGLASGRFTLGVKTVGEDTVFFGRLNHPFAERHFVQFLNSVSPFAGQDARGIIDDIELPILAERDYGEDKNKTTSEFIRLHERHLNDPRVGPPYIRFAEDHANSWLKALESRSSQDVFLALERVKFIKDLKKFTDDSFSNFKSSLKTSY